MIKQIYFENFKSFKKTTIQIKNITTLIGTNAAGKTNMMEGLMILSEIMSGRELSAILDGTKNRDIILQYIKKEPEKKEDYSWLED